LKCGKSHGRYNVLTYYLVFFSMWIPALNTKDRLTTKSLPLMFILFGLFLIILTGLRHEVGGDWFPYLNQYNRFVPNMTYTQSLVHNDPFFWLISRLNYDLGWGVYGINLMIAIIFIIGLYRLLKQQPNPWLGLAVAFPYLIIVVSMGYTRQAAAIGFIMLGISYLKEGKFWRFILSVFFATTFHKTAVIMIGIGMFQKGKGRIFKIIATLFLGMGLWSAFLAEDQAALIQNYIVAQMESSGALIRVMMNIIPAFILFYTRKRWNKLFNDYNFWKFIALASILSLPLLSISSTVVDRISLYFIPLQIVVFSRLPLLLEKKIKKKRIKLLILVYYFTVLSVWLMMGTFSFCWLPYQNIIFHNLL